MFTEVPKTAMFNCCGEVPNKKGSSVKEVMADAVQQLACAIATSNAGKSADQIDGRSKCYRQLTELKSLRDTGVLSENECKDECDAIKNTW